VFLDVTVSSFDCMEQLSALMRDPILYGSESIPHGNGEPVLLLPGYFVGDWAMAPMARWLRRIGYNSYLSGIDFNLGCPREKLEHLEARVIGMPARPIAASPSSDIASAECSLVRSAVRCRGWSAA